MTEPRRLLEQLGPGFERELLVLGGTEAAPKSARRRVEASLFGIGPLATVALCRPETAVATSGASAPGGTWLAVAAKWLAIGVVAGSATGVATALPVEESAAPPPRLQAVARSVVVAAAGVASAPAARGEPALEPLPAAKEPARASRRPLGTVLIGKPALGPAR